MFYNEMPANHLRDKVDEILDSWRAGTPPNALAVLDELPQLKQHPSLAVDLAYEEYCLRSESGEAVDAKVFCQKFGGLRRSIARMLSMHRVMQSMSLGIPTTKTVEWPALGSQWLDWRLTEEIGRGAFSRVFLAEEPALGNRKVVVKCSTSGPDEAFVLGKLDHPNVMPIHSIRHDEQQGLVGICMPFAGRVTLAEVIDELGCRDADSELRSTIWPPNQDSQPASPDDYTIHAAQLIESVARGLHAAHEAKVLHGDIKPSNIILSFAGEPRLVDFNLSDDASGGRQRLGGTPPYMAPERLKMLVPGSIPKPNSVAQPADFRSDVFSLGVVFYELLYGQTPFEFDADDLQFTYDIDSMKGWKSLQNLGSQAVPAEVIAIVERSIAFDPEERFASAQEFADELALWIEQQTEAKRRKATRSLFSWPMLSAVVLTLTLILAFAAAIAGQGLWLAAPDNAQGPNPTPVLPEHSAEHQALELAIQDIADGKFDIAAVRLTQVSQKHSSPAIHAWLGYCWVGVRNYDNARVCFLQAKPDSDLTGRIWHNIGCCETRSKLTSSSIGSFSKALRFDPKLQKAYEQRAIAKMRVAMTEQMPPLEGMVDDMESALSLSKDDPYILLEAARVYSCAAKQSGDSNADKYQATAESFIRRGLAAGIPLQSFEGLGNFDLPKMMPVPPPPPAAKRKTIDAFVVPPYDLQKVLESMP